MSLFFPIREVSSLLFLIAMFATMLLAFGHRSPLIPAAILAGICINFTHNNAVFGQYDLLGRCDLEFMQAFELIQEFALLLMLFTAGLEIEIKKFAQAIHIACSMLLFEIFISLLCAIIISCFTALEPSTLLLYTFVFTLSSTVCAVKAIESYDNNYNVYALQILVIQDIALAVMLLLLQTISTTQEFIITTIVQQIGFYLVPLIGVLVLAYLYRNKPKLLIGNSESDVVATLCWCSFVSGLFYHWGISCEYGAFLAGLTLSALCKTNRVIDVIAPITTFFGVGFFVYIGLKTNITFFMTNTLQIASLVLLGLGLKIATNVLGLHSLIKNYPISMYNGILLGIPSELSFILIHSVEAILGQTFHTQLLESMVIMCIFLSSFWFDRILESKPRKTKPKVSMIK